MDRGRAGNAGAQEEPGHGAYAEGLGAHAREAEDEACQARRQEGAEQEQALQREAGLGREALRPGKRPQAFFGARRHQQGAQIRPQEHAGHGKGEVGLGEELAGRQRNPGPGAEVGGAEGRRQLLRQEQEDAGQGQAEEQEQAGLEGRAGREAGKALEKGLVNDAAAAARGQGEADHACQKEQKAEGTNIALEHYSSLGPPFRRTLVSRRKAAARTAMPAGSRLCSCQERERAASPSRA